MAFLLGRITPWPPPLFIALLYKTFWKDIIKVKMMRGFEAMAGKYHES